MGDINEAPDRLAIGIDFGTSNCRVAAIINGKLKIFTDEFGNRSIPSIVVFDDRQVYIGEKAREMAENFPSNSIFNVKWLLGRFFIDTDVERLRSEKEENNEKNKVKTAGNKTEMKEHVVISDSKAARNEEEMEALIFDYEERKGQHGGVSGKVKPEARSLIRINVNEAIRFYAPEEIAALLLTYLRNLASSQLSKEITRAVVSVPAGFDSLQRAALLDAGKIAGLHLDLISDPAAAALAFHKQSRFPRLLFIADWGAGSLETAVVRIATGTVEVVSASSWSLGGMELDKVLMQYLTKEFQKHSEDATKRTDNIRLKTSCQKVRITLSSVARANLEIVGVEGGPDFNMVVNRATMEHLFQDVFQEAERRVREELQRANVNTDEVEEIILIGGISQTPMFRKMIENVFHSRRPFVSFSINESVLCGAAYYAEVINYKDCCDENQNRIKEIYPESVGVEVEKGLIRPLFQRNCQLPAHCTKALVSAKDVHSPLTINLFTGESMMTKNCSFFCQINVHGIQPARKNEVIFRFDIDRNGIFDISSSSNVELTTDFLHNRLSELKISKMEEFTTKSLAIYDGDRERLKCSNEFKIFCHTMMAALMCDEVHLLRRPEDCENFKKSIQDALDKIDNLQDVSTATLQSQLEQLKAQSRNFLGDV